MPKVRPALTAKHFGTAHKKTAVFFFSQIFWLQRRIKTGPTAAGVEFGVGSEQLSATTGASVNARVFAVVIFAGEGALGTFLARDPVLLRREDFLPFL
jgi:hypothetical protein